MTPIEAAREAATLKAAEVLKACFEFGGARPVRDVVGEILAAYEASLSAQGLVIVPKAASEWRPIEGAPKDGAVVDLWVSNSRGEQFRVADCFWSTPLGPHASREVGWFGDANGDGRSLFIEPTWRVTNWMPLPAPPSPHNSNPTQGDKPEGD